MNLILYIIVVLLALFVASEPSTNPVFQILAWLEEELRKVRSGEEVKRLEK